MIAISQRQFVGSLAMLTLLLPASLQAADAPDPKLREAITNGVDFLLTKGQAADGSYSAKAGPAITAICTTAILKQGRSPDDPRVAKSLKYLEGFVRPTGGVHADKSRLSNYENCICLVCFSAANKDGRYTKLIAAAEKFAKGLQFDGTDGKDPADIDYGGVGYGGSTRPDLSNTAMLMEALEAAGGTADDEAVQRALVFISKCQNLESEKNTTEFSAKNPDGGFFYTPAAGGSSAAGKTEEGALRSYGSMTYAGLKSMIFAGVKADDPRVKAATKWLQTNYSVAENPGMGQAGVYYYYHLMAKSLDALGKAEFVDAKGNLHDWRKELSSELIKRQNPNGSWTNENEKWMEGDANLCTAFALLTLGYCSGK